MLEITAYDVWLCDISWLASCLYINNLLLINKHAQHTNTTHLNEPQYTAYDVTCQHAINYSET